MAARQNVRLVPETEPPAMSRREAIAKHQQLLELHKLHLEHWSQYVQAEEDMVCALEKELKYLNSISDDSFDISLNVGESDNA